MIEICGLFVGPSLIIRKLPRKGRGRKKEIPILLKLYKS